MKITSESPCDFVSASLCELTTEINIGCEWEYFFGHGFGLLFEIEIFFIILQQPIDQWIDWRNNWMIKWLNEKWQILKKLKSLNDKNDIDIKNIKMGN